MTAKRDFNKPIYSQSPLWNALLHASRPRPEDDAAEKQAVKDHLRAVIQSGVDVNEWGKMDMDYAYSPLLYALLIMNDLGVVQDLLAHGANINVQDVYGNTPVMNVLIYPQPLVLLDFLVDRGADLTIKNVIDMDAMAHLDRRTSICAASDDAKVRDFAKIHDRQARAALERGLARKPSAPRPPKP